MRLTWELAFFVVLMVLALFGFVYGFKRWRQDSSQSQLSAWRRMAVNFGLAALGVQITLFVLFWSPIGRDYLLFARWARWVFPTFLVAFCCVLAGKGPSRWWLLSSSVILFVICFFIVLSV